MHDKREQLTSEEKAQIRAVLSAHIGYREPVFSRARARVKLFYSVRAAAAGFASIMFVAGSVSYAAENALPGDFLYAVKIEVNERARSLTAVTPQQEAAWSVMRTTRRLEELEKLIVKGDLGSKTDEETTARFEHNTDEANAVIAQLKKESIDAAVVASSRLEESLRIHERALTQVAEGREDITQVSIILETVREKARSVSEIRREIEKERMGESKSTNEDAAEKTDNGKGATSTVSDVQTGTTTEEKISTTTEASLPR